jgi:hypothetical protein
MFFNLANLPYWIFLGLGILLFILVISGGIGDTDSEIEIDGDIEIDTDLDVDAEIESDGDFSIIPFLAWLGAGQAPLLLLLAIDLSLWGAIGWTINILLSSLLGRIPTTFIGLGGVIFFLSMVISLFAGSLIARPLGQLFAAFGEDTSSDRLIGCTGTVSSAIISPDKMGQVDVLDGARNFVTVSAKLPDWARVTPRRGNSVIVIDRHPQHYVVIVKDSPDEEEWLSNWVKSR